MSTEPLDIRPGRRTKTTEQTEPKQILTITVFVGMYDWVKKHVKASPEYRSVADYIRQLIQKDRERVEREEAKKSA